MTANKKYISDKKCKFKLSHEFQEIAAPSISLTIPPQKYVWEECKKCNRKRVKIL